VVGMVVQHQMCVILIVMRMLVRHLVCIILIVMRMVIQHLVHVMLIVLKSLRGDIVHKEGATYTVLDQRFVDFNTATCAIMN